MEGTNVYNICLSCGKMLLTIQERVVGKCVTCQLKDAIEKGKK